DDVVLNSAWMSNTSGYEFGRVPEAHLTDSIVLGGEVFNFGINTQTNIEISMNINDASGASLVSESAVIESLENDTSDFQQLVMTGLSLNEGMYELSTSVTSDDDNANGENFSNNTYTRDFAVTKNLYSIDGIGIYNDDIISLGVSIGTNYGNGTTVMARYELLEETTVVGLEIALSSNTDAGAQIFAFLVDSSDVDDLSSSNRLAENQDGVIVNQWNIDDNLLYTALETTTLDPGVYYACAELFNGPNEDDIIYILNDATVAQPFDASMIHVQEDNGPVTYTNGVGVAIRLAIGDYIGLEEASNALFSVSPNPSNGVFTVIASEEDNYTLEVINVLGEIVSTKLIDGSINETINISNLNAGIYLVKVSTATSQNVQRVVIK
ncbi:T9SS type A sorting domain-containing protein, partial [bacterium]|nr:T9SS type A sorting domain-containing protein [bacterium]